MLTQLSSLAILEVRKMTKYCMVPADLMTPSSLDIPAWEIQTLAPVKVLSFKAA